jgi:hypothetical protein
LKYSKYDKVGWKEAAVTRSAATNISWSTLKISVDDLNGYHVRGEVVTTVSINCADVVATPPTLGRWEGFGGQSQTSVRIDASENV